MQGLIIRRMVVVILFLVLIGCSQKSGHYAMEEPVSADPTLHVGVDSENIQNGRVETDLDDLVIDRRVSSLMEMAISARDEADIDMIDALLADLSTAGLLDTVVEELSLIEKRTPGVYFTLAAIYGRKGLREKAYAAMVAAEEAAMEPGAVFSLTAIYGRKALLATPIESGVCSLTVTSDPPGSRVLVDGKDAGPAPVRIEAIRAGVHEIVVSCLGYDSVRTELEGIDGGTIATEVSLKASPVPCSIKTDVDGAIVFIDNVETGYTPWNGTLYPGNRELRLVSNNYETEEIFLSVPIGGDPIHIERELTTGSAKIIVDCDPPGPSLSFNGMELGALPLTCEYLPAGVYEIGSFNFWTSDGTLYNAVKPMLITVEKGQTVNVKLKPIRAIALLTAPVGGYPNGSVVELDGKKIGVVPFANIEHNVGMFLIRIKAGSKILLDTVISLNSGMNLIQP